MSFILDVYGKSWNNIICLVGDNVAVNKSISTKVDVPLVGCASHRYNLAVRDVIAGEIELVNKFNTLISKLRTLLLSSKLRKLTPLLPKICNEILCSSSFEMLRRYCQLQKYLPKLNSAEVDELQSTVSENRRVDALVTRLNDLDEVTKKLQCDSTTVSDVRDLFNAVIDVFPETAFRLSSTAEIVHGPVFESAVVELQRKNNCGLSREERISVKPFETMERRNVELCESSMSFVDRALSSDRRGLKNRECTYADTRFVVSTSNISERLFSQVGTCFRIGDAV